MPINTEESTSAEAPVFPGFEAFVSTLRPGQIALGLFEALPDVLFWIKDRQSRFVFVNLAFSDLIRRQLLGDCTGPMGFQLPEPADVPLRAWLAESTGEVPATHLETPGEIGRAHV